jgi:hypothetical protein
MARPGHSFSKAQKRGWRQERDDAGTPGVELKLHRSKHRPTEAVMARVKWKSQHIKPKLKRRQNMTDTNVVIAAYDNHAAAEDAVRELQKSGFDMKKLSVVGKDYHTDEQVVGYYNAGDRMKYWGK